MSLEDVLAKRDTLAQYLGDIAVRGHVSLTQGGDGLLVLLDAEADEGKLPRTFCDLPVTVQYVAGKAVA